MAIAPAAGTKFYISTLPVTDTNPDTIGEFGALSWVEVKEVETIGDYGDEANLIPFASLSDGRVRKQKGARDAGTLALVCGADPTDPGQLLMITAEASEYQYAFRIIINDSQSVAMSDSIHYFRGLVGSKRLGIGGVDNIPRRTFNIGITSAIYEIPAATIVTT